MKFTYKNESGFNFVKVGEFYKSSESLTVTYKGKKYDIDLAINFIDEVFKNSDESAYLILINDTERVYVGEFSYNLEDRWLRKGKYVWHDSDEKIIEELNKNNKVSLWLTVDPFYELPNGTKINISKSIEQEVLKNIYPDWNVRGQMKKHAEWREQYCIPVYQLLKNSKET